MVGQPLTATLTVGAAHLPLRHAVQASLRSAIIDGVYAPGDRLIEEEVAARLDVSRNPIREALQALAGEGFVVIEPRRGARVATVGPERAKELFEVRAPLEGLVARLAAQRRTPDQLHRLRAVLADGTGAAEGGRLEELPALNTQFHATLAAAADNDLLTETLARLSDLIRWVYAAHLRERSTKSWIEHAAIVQAVAAGDPEAAERAGTSHIAAAASVYEMVH